MLDALTRTMLHALPQSHDNPELNRFYRLLRDYPERGGKRIRGLLVLHSAAAHGVKDNRALEVAAALELFQNWVLIHDDIEDDSEERRGTPALHRQVGMPVALNVGDALHVQMWGLLHGLEGFSDSTFRAILREFGWMIKRTAEGQHLDLSWVQQGRFDVTEREYLEMVTLKTAYYTVVCPLRLGALCAEVTPDERFVAAGQALGVGFQIRDDVLNLLPEVSYGKEFAGDLYEGKRTLILAHAFAQATAAERSEMESLLAKSRVEKTEADITRLLALINGYGSLEYAQEVAEKQAQTGMTLLREALEPLAQTGGDFAELTGLLESVVSRRQ